MMTKIITADFLMEKNKTDSVFHLINHLSDSDNLCPSCSADDYISRQREYRFVGKDDLPSVHFESMDMKEGDSPLFILSSDEFICLITEKGEMGQLFYKEGKDTEFVQEKDPEEALRLIIKFANKDIRERARIDPEKIIKRDLEKRKIIEERNLLNKINELEINQEEFPDDFWDSIIHVYEHSSNLKEFQRMLKSGDAIVFGCRPLQRLQRATIALGENCEESYEECAIYRALPSGSIIEEGDWVSTSESYAQSHERNSDNAITVSEVVYDDEIYDGGSPDEQIYVPRNTWKGAESVRDVWEMVNVENKPNGSKVEKRTYDEIMAEKEKSNSMSL